MQKEIWKAIPGYEGIYEASTLGNIRSLDRAIVCKNGKKLPRKGCIIKPNIDSNGYLKFDLRNAGKRKAGYVHKIIAITFLNHKPNGFETVINHKDFNTKNNRLDNLEITSQRNNTNKKHIKSTSSYTGVSWRKQKRKWEAKIFHNGKSVFLGLHDTEVEAAKAYNDYKATIK